MADGRTNALIVGGEAEDMDAADALIKRLDVQPDASGVTVQVFPLTKADALQIAATLRSLYSTQLAPTGPVTPGKGGPVGSPPLNLQGEPLINISADTRLNAVVISAGQTDMTQIAELIRQLDGDVLTQVAEIRVFPLKFADAVEASTVLTTAITARAKAASSATGAAGNKQQVLQFVAKPSQGGVLSTALEQDIVITPDKRTNSLVVSASVDSMPLVESLIKAMDSINTQEAQIRVFKLTNADARQMADVLTQLFGLKTGGTGGQRAITYTLLATTAAGGAATQPSAAVGTPDTGRATATVGNAEQYALSVTVDIRTNSLLVGGTRRYVDLVDKIIAELDESPAQERMTEVYRLRNAQAVDIETALKNFLSQERDRVVAALGKDHMGAAERLLEKEVAVVAEKVSNSLLLSASPRYFKTIETMIRELDQAPPQVLIQALLAEVTLDNTTELGFEWAYKFNVAGSTATMGDNFGNMVKNPNAGNPLPVPGNNNIFPGGFSAAVTGGDLSLLFRALQNQGKLEVLSRPQILASDNQSADIIVGQKVPLPNDVRINDNSTFTSVKYEDVGIKLIVLPRINPDGSVKLQVHPEISSLSSSTVNIAGATSSPIINNRSATTTINVQDGHTIIIGGLITSKDDERDKKVPLLGDIPVLEWFFKDKTKTTERTELLIVLTPRVLRTTDKSDSVTQTQIERLNALRNIKRESLNKELAETIHSSEPSDIAKKEAENPLKPEVQGSEGNTKDVIIDAPKKP